MSKQPVSFKTSEPTFAEKIRSRFRQKFLGSASCLLCDISTSMDESVNGNDPRAPTKIQELRKLVDKFPLVRRFVFGSVCQEIKATDTIPGTRGSTAMHEAFLTVKSAGIEHAVLITDGYPDDVHAAICCAKGLRLDIFYIGPDPPPPFLKKLAEDSGGQYGRTTFAHGTGIFEAKIRGLLPVPGGPVIKL